MRAAFSGDGFRSLRLAWIALGVAVVAAAGIAYGGYWYEGKAKRSAAEARRQLSEATTQLEAVRRESDNLRASAEIFQDLVKRGILLPENRLAFVERLDALKSRHRIMALEYEIAPQRTLPLSGGVAPVAVDIFGSRIRVTARALHEGDALAFLEDLVQPPRGFTPATRCHLQRLDAANADATAPRVEAQCTLEWITLREKRGPLAR